MSDVQLYLFEAEKDKKEATRIAANTAQKLEAKTLKLLEVIESLGEYLNSDDGSIRAKTMSYLAEVLQATQPKVLSGQHRSLLYDFVLSRISDDTEGIPSCAVALIALEKLGQWDQARAAKVMTTLIHHTHPVMQYKLTSERYPIYVLLDVLMSEYRPAIHGLHQESNDFLPRFIAYFDGEKDPRNLMIVFSILRVIGTEWDVSASAQDVFEASFNYFPITFRPPPGDQVGITAQDLKERLKLCISASSSFAPYAFPALLEKLDSTSMNVKRDVLQALESCVREFGPSTVNLYSVNLWDPLKFEVLAVQEEDLAEATLKVLAQISRVLSLSQSGALAVYLKPVVKECNEHLEDAPTKQSQGATRMLSAIASSSAAACNHVLAGVLPTVMQLYQGTKDVAKRRALVETLTHLIRADITVFGEWRRDLTQVGTGAEPSTLEKASNNALRDYAVKALEILTATFSITILSQVSYRLVLLDAMLQLAKVRALLDDDQISSIISIFDNIVISEESYGKDEVKVAAINALVEIAHQKAQLVISKSFPDFLARLPDTDVGSSENYVPILEAFAKLGSEEAVFGTVVLRLKNKLHAAIQQQASATYIHSILSALLYAFNSESDSIRQSTTFQGAFQDIMQPLIRKFCIEAHPNQQDDTTYYLLGRLANTILRAQTTEQQQGVAVEVYTLFLGITNDAAPPFSPNLSALEERRLFISTHIIAALRKDVTLPVDVSSAVTALIRYSLMPTIPNSIRQASLQQLSVLLNKFLPTSSTKSIVESLPSQGLDLSNDATVEAVPTLFAILKALVLRNAPGLISIFSPLVRTLQDQHIGLIVAHGFATLLQPDDILTKDNHCTISALHKQKTFAVLIPDITSGFKTTDTAHRSNYLIALAGIIRWLPYAVLEPQLTVLIPLLLQTLDITGEEDVKAGTIDTLNTVLRENPKTVEEHTSSLISRLLNCASLKGNSALVRAKALTCLALTVTQLRRELVIPFRKQVVKRLTIPLDDRKRVVRLEAVRCRAKWIEMDEAGDESE